MITLTFPDGTKKQFKKGVTGKAVAESIGERLARDALAITVNDEVKDLSTSITKDANIRILTFKDEEGKEVFWHSASHLMTQAVLRVFKGQDIGLGVGMPVEDGFYQDYDIKDLHDEDLAKIEEEMKKIVKEKLEITQRDIPKKEALTFYKKDPYKIELANAVPGDQVSMYKQGEFDNLCKGPHVPNTSYLKFFKLTKIAGAYWRGDAQNTMLTRIYGVAFPDKKLLKDYLHLKEEAAKRDHRKIGKAMELFVFSDLVGPGMPLYTGKGRFLRQQIIQYSRELNTKIGYEEVDTPNVTKADLFKLSGHYDKFKDDMFQVVSHYGKDEFFLKPMNCPMHTQLYAAQARSYKDLPIRISDFANLYRDEIPGALSGLTRLRCFSQDDGHCFCREDQIKEEFENVLGVVQEALNTYGLQYYIRLSLWDPKEKEKYLGDAKTWETSQKLLRELLEENKLAFVEEVGEAAFYGPKMDIVAKDSLQREWQISTIQLDFNMPKRFELTYQDADGKEKTPVMIHRAIIGSPDRFLGILIEHYAGKFPLWMNPNQVVILPVADRFIDYAEDVAAALRKEGIRADVDDRQESISKKVRDGEINHYNYILVVGEKEIGKKKVTVRTRENQVEGMVDLNAFVKRLKEEKGAKA